MPAKARFLLTILAMLVPQTAAAATFSVNSTGDERDCDPADGVCAIDDGAGGCLPACTLRAALQQAGDDPGQDTIVFAIPDGSEIQITSNMMADTTVSAVVVDGTSSGGSITLQGNGYFGMIVLGPGEVRGIDFVGFGLSALTITGDGVTVRDCGFFNSGNHGLQVAGGLHTIGEPGATISNIFAGNGGSGIFFDTGSDNTLVQNNAIGTADGMTAMPNEQSGIFFNGGTNIIVGGPNQYEGNLISGNESWGIHISRASGVVIQGNDIGVNVQADAPLTGTDAQGDPIVGNGFGGIFVAQDVAGVEIGADIPLSAPCQGACNVISGNPIAVSALDGVTEISGNFIGVDGTGSMAVPNNNGIRVYSPGGQISQNLISGNRGYGLEVAGQFDVIDNVVGLDAVLATRLPNVETGVLCRGGGVLLDGNQVAGGDVGIDLVGPAIVTDNTIGPSFPSSGPSVEGSEGGVGINVGSVAGPGEIRDNVIGGWQIAGISVSGTAEAPVTGLSIQRNRLAWTAWAVWSCPTSSMASFSKTPWTRTSAVQGARAIRSRTLNSVPGSSWLRGRTPSSPTTTSRRTSGLGCGCSRARGTGSRRTRSSATARMGSGSERTARTSIEMPRTSTPGRTACRIVRCSTPCSSRPTALARCRAS